MNYFSPDNKHNKKKLADETNRVIKIMREVLIRSAKNPAVTAAKGLTHIFAMPNVPPAKTLNEKTSVA